MALKGFIAIAVIGALIAICGNYAFSFPTHANISQDALRTLFEQIPSESPVIFVRVARNVLPDSKVVIVGTALCLTDRHRSRSAKLYFFSLTDTGWQLLYETNMDDQIIARGLPPDWEIRLEQVAFADLTGDGRDEIVVLWGSRPPGGVSLSQYTTILHVYKYTEEAHSFTEITDDQIVFTTDLEKALLLNVDADPETEIVFFEEIWEPDSCVVGAKRFQITVWTLVGGTLALDPDWNSGLPLETEEKLSLSSCGFPILLHLTLERAACLQTKNTTTITGRNYVQNNER